MDRALTARNITRRCFSTSCPSSDIIRKGYVTPSSWKKAIRIPEPHETFHKKLRAGQRHIPGAKIAPYVKQILKEKFRNFQNPTGRGPFYFGKGVPFPDNPTFKPPRPVANSTKEKVYNTFVKLTTSGETIKIPNKSKKVDGKTNQGKADSKGEGENEKKDGNEGGQEEEFTYKKLNPVSEDHAVRVLSERFSIPLLRVKAIIRLKAVEKSWIENGIPLQTNFNKNMERLLGSKMYIPQSLSMLKQQQQQEKKKKAQEDVDSDELSESENTAEPTSKSHYEMHLDRPSLLMPENLRYYSEIAELNKTAEEKIYKKKVFGKSKIIPASRETQAPIHIVDVTGTKQGLKWEDTWIDKPRQGKDIVMDSSKHPMNQPGPRHPLKWDQPLPLPDHLKLRKPPSSSSSPEQEKKQ